MSPPALTKASSTSDRSSTASSHSATKPRSSRCRTGTTAGGDRESGDWGRYVAREVIPEVSRRRFDADPHRVAIGGPSMGGFGAYHLALRYKGYFCAVSGHSAGLWIHDDEAFPDAFDNHADFEQETT
ncbi:MAG: alpha/beta hydrolase-fold protein [Solirubrobacterales bacterium]